MHLFLWMDHGWLTDASKSVRKCVQCRLPNESYYNLPYTQKDVEINKEKASYWASSGENIMGCVWVFLFYWFWVCKHKNMNTLVVLFNLQHRITKKCPIDRCLHFLIWKSNAPKFCCASCRLWVFVGPQRWGLPTLRLLQTVTSSSEGLMWSAAPVHFSRSAGGSSCVSTRSWRTHPRF